MILPVFTLPIFLLPEGHTRIRVFEPRYLKLVRIASQNQGFVIYNSDKHNEDVGSLVDIINFEQGDDGVLIIDVHCRSLVSLKEFSKDEENLTFATASEIEHWQSLNLDHLNKDAESDELFQALKSIFDKNDLLKQIYKGELKHDPKWVVARWIEILPVQFEDKRSFFNSDSFNKAKSFVYSIVVKQACYHNEQ